MALRELLSTCNFCEQCRDSLTRDRIVVGLRDPVVIKKLCAAPCLTLNKAVEICRAEEAADRDVTAIVGHDVAIACRVTGANRRGPPPEYETDSFERIQSSPSPLTGDPDPVQSDLVDQKPIQSNL